MSFIIWIQRQSHLQPSRRIRGGEVTGIGEIIHEVESKTRKGDIFYSAKSPGILYSLLQEVDIQVNSEGIKKDIYNCFRNQYNNAINSPNGFTSFQAISLPEGGLAISVGYFEAVKNLIYVQFLLDGLMILKGSIGFSTDQDRSVFFRTGPFFYYQEGSLFQKLLYKDGNLDGIQTEYHEDGSVAYQEKWTDGEFGYTIRMVNGKYLLDECRDGEYHYWRLSGTPTVSQETQPTIVVVHNNEPVKFLDIVDNKEIERATVHEKQYNGTRYRILIDRRPDQCVYCGCFEFDESTLQYCYSGAGVLFDSKMHCLYKGQWKHGQYCGHGSLYSKDLKVEEGEYRDGQSVSVTRYNGGESYMTQAEEEIDLKYYPSDESLLLIGEKGLKGVRSIDWNLDNLRRIKEMHLKQDSLPDLVECVIEGKSKLESVTIDESSLTSCKQFTIRSRLSDCFQKQIVHSSERWSLAPSA